MNKEKMIVVEKSTKWWMGVVAAGSLAVGALGGFGIGVFTTGNSINQQAVQVGNGQDGQFPQGKGGMQGGPGGQGMPEGQFPQGKEGAMKGGPGNQDGQMQGGPNGNMNGDESTKSAPSNADGTTKSDKTDTTTDSSTSKS